MEDVRKELKKYIAEDIREEKNLLLQAPTATGKTYIASAIKREDVILGRSEV